MEGRRERFARKAKSWTEFAITRNDILSLSDPVYIVRSAMKITIGSLHLSGSGGVVRWKERGR